MACSSAAASANRPTRITLTSSCSPPIIHGARISPPPWKPARRLSSQTARPRNIWMRLRVAERILGIRGIFQLVLPICAYCKKIREDSAYWQQFEEYIKEHTGSQFSDGICPECLEKEMHEFNSRRLPGRQSSRRLRSDRPPRGVTGPGCTSGCGMGCAVPGWFQALHEFKRANPLQS